MPKQAPPGVGIAAGRYRAGPWPGLTPRGAAVLLGCALLLALSGMLVDRPRQAWPDLAILAVVACAPMMLATRITRVPGAAAAVSGVYLLPRALISLLQPSLEPPPLLLVPALALDLSLWLRASDLGNAGLIWPGRKHAWRRRERSPRTPSRARTALAGALFGLVLALVQPPFAVLLGAAPAVWSGPDVWLASSLAALGCGIEAAALSGRGTESRPPVRPTG